MALGNIAVVLGSGYLSTILTGGDAKKVPIIGDTLAHFVKNTGKHDSNDQLASQLNSIKEEVQRVVRRRDENVTVISDTSGSGSYTITAIVVAGLIGYTYIRWKGWKISDMMWVTKRGLADACDVVGKQLDGVSNTVQVTKKHLSGRIDRVDANLDETQEIIEGTRDEVAVIHVDLSAFQKELQEVSRTVEIWGSRLSGIEDTQDRTVRATEALVGFSQQLEHSGQNPNIRQVSSFLPALGSSSEQKIKILPQSPLVSLQTVASVAEPSEDESQENHKVLPSSDGSMRWKLPGLGLSFLRSSSDV
ncbi:hypothetical protein CFC21_000146 [Triticum aestivum]|uniref:DUF1664 domain-containing protein n=2 Tax=Triticum TaxID=4564 RepID=A0A9R0UT86_TRITD|nr:uncharacterized protein LOC123185075 [Triticum aestivum]KAF6981683.1 hypothetical protein CFC21_000146 [Triticum aestivum]VAH00291.1 unnamed protein product [Triticum turgidum subsp. durum]